MVCGLPNSGLLKRYIAIKKRGLERKLTSGTFTTQGFTKHEALILPNLMDSLNDQQKITISTALVKTLRDIFTGRKTPGQDISTIYNLFKDK